MWGTFGDTRTLRTIRIWISDSRFRTATMHPASSMVKISDDLRHGSTAAMRRYDGNPCSDLYITPLSVDRNLYGAIAISRMAHRMRRAFSFRPIFNWRDGGIWAVSYTHLRAH